MDDNTMKLLADLATKLGTTAEYLWSALLRQAPIWGTATIALYTITLSFLAFLWWNLIRKEFKYHNGDIKGFTYIALSVLTGFIMMGFWIDLPTIVAAFYNPEFWALKQVLK